MSAAVRATSPAWRRGASMTPLMPEGDRAGTRGIRVPLVGRKRTAGEGCRSSCTTEAVL